MFVCDPFFWWLCDSVCVDDNKVIEKKSPLILPWHQLFPCSPYRVERSCERKTVLRQTCFSCITCILTESIFAQKIAMHWCHAGHSIYRRSDDAKREHKESKITQQQQRYARVDDDGCKCTLLIHVVRRGTINWQRIHMQQKKELMPENYSYLDVDCFLFHFVDRSVLSSSQFGRSSVSLWCRKCVQQTTTDPAAAFHCLTTVHTCNTHFWGSEKTHVSQFREKGKVLQSSSCLAEGWGKTGSTYGKSGYRKTGIQREERERGTGEWESIEPGVRSNRIKGKSGMSPWECVSFPLFRRRRRSIETCYSKHCTSIIQNPMSQEKDIIWLLEMCVRRVCEYSSSSSLFSHTGGKRDVIEPVSHPFPNSMTALIHWLPSLLLLLRKASQWK